MGNEKKGAKEKEAMQYGYWWIEALLGVLLIVAPFAGKFTAVHPAAYTDVIAGALLVIWAVVGYWYVGGMKTQRPRSSHA